MNTVACEIVQRLASIQHCRNNGNKEWEEKHTAKLADLCQRFLPHGSGIDMTYPDSLHGLYIEKTSSVRIVIALAYHHMNEHGYYDGWTDHTIIATPRFDGIDVRVTGSNRNDIKDYLGELYHMALNQKIEIS